MNELILFTDDGKFPVDGRMLHERLGVETEYRHWFPRMCEYGFKEGVDFNPVKNDRVQIEGNRHVTREVASHMLTISMAKELCMLQRTPQGKQVRQYLITVEEQWNQPDAVIARALLMAGQRLKTITAKADAQERQIAELLPKATYCDLVLSTKDAAPISVIAKDYGWSPQRMNAFLHEQGVQYRRGKTWLLYQKYAGLGYTDSTTNVFHDRAGNPHPAIHTRWTQQGRLFIYEMMKANGHLPLIERESAA